MPSFGGEVKESVPRPSFAACNFIQVLKSWKMGWMGHVACMGDNTNAYTLLMENLEERDH